jgi:hypothetical protein
MSEDKIAAASKPKRRRQALGHVASITAFRIDVRFGTTASVTPRTLER